MADYGKTISELRKREGITQAELGEILHVSAQAVSKWENGLSEPDLETLNKLCGHFNVSLDNFFKNNIEKASSEAEKPDAEVSATTAEADGATEQPTQNAQICGYCEKCKKPLYVGFYKVDAQSVTKTVGRTSHTVTEQHVYCDDCFKQITEKRAADEKRKKEIKAAVDRESSRKRYFWGITIGVLVALALFLLTFFLYPVIFDKNNLKVVLLILLPIGGFSMATQIFWGSEFISDILDFFSRSFHLPGFIFSWDLDSIIRTILLKWTLSLLAGLLSLAIFLIGVVVATLCSYFTLPFAFVKATKCVAHGIPFGDD